MEEYVLEEIIECTFANAYTVWDLRVVSQIWMSGSDLPQTSTEIKCMNMFCYTPTIVWSF